MVNIYILQGMSYLFGPIDTEFIKERFLIPNGFTPSKETLIYPPNIYLKGHKDIVLTNEKTNTDRSASIDFVFSKVGFSIVRLSTEITVDEYSTIDSELFSNKSSNFVLVNLSLQEIIWKLAENIFGKTIIDFQLDHDLNSEYFREFCKKYAIIPVGGLTNVSISSFVSISNKDDWDEIIKAELQKAQGGSILRNLVAIPNFSNTAISLDPDIKILNSLNILIYTNDFLIRDTVNLVLGIQYQKLGLEFLKRNLGQIQTNLIEIQNYYENPGKSQISWIYIDKALTNLENKFNKFISNYELEFLDLNDPIYINFNSINFIDHLNQMLEYYSAKKHYTQMKNHTKEILSSLRSRVSDKGEKEEKQAYNRIVAIVGLLAIFQIVPSVLPLFTQNLFLFNQTFSFSTLIRIIFLVIFFPSLVLIWYVTTYNNQRKVKLAEKIEHQRNLIRQKQFLSEIKAYYTNTSNQEVFKISMGALEVQITSLNEKIEAIERELTKINKI